MISNGSLGFLDRRCLPLGLESFSADPLYLVLSESSDSPGFFEGGFGVEVIDLGPGGVLFVIAAWAFWAYIIVYLRMLDSSLCCPPVFVSAGRGVILSPFTLWVLFLQTSFMLTSYGLGAGVGWVVAHKILVTAQSPSSSFPLWAWTLDLDSGLSIYT